LEGYYRGEIGIVKSFDGSSYIIKLLKKALEIKLEENEFKKVPKDEIEKEKIKISFSDGTEIYLKDRDLRYTSDYLKNNYKFRGLYALGKYYSKEEYPEKYETDYFTQQVLIIKNFNRTAAEEIAKIYNYFIYQSKILKEIVNNIDYVFFMPSINYKNHVELWGSILCEKIGIQEVSNILIIPEN